MIELRWVKRTKLRQHGYKPVEYMVLQYRTLERDEQGPYYTDWRDVPEVEQQEEKQ